VTQEEPVTTAGMRTVVYPVSDLAGATRLFRTLLGRVPTTDQPYYVGFDVDDREVGLDPNGDPAGAPSATGTWRTSTPASSSSWLPGPGQVGRSGTWGAAGSSPR
jgi:hypothetical protein